MVESTPQSSSARRRGPGPWTGRETRQAARLWQDGMSAAAIAKAIGKSRNAVLGKIARLGLGRSNGRDCRQPGPDCPADRSVPLHRQRRFAWSSDHRMRLVRHWKEGLATDEIAARLGCSEALVVERAAAAGLIRVEAPERHSSPHWFARNDARFRAALQRAVDQGLVTVPRSDTRPVPGSAKVGRSHGN